MTNYTVIQMNYDYMLIETYACVYSNHIERAEYFANTIFGNLKEKKNHEVRRSGYAMRRGQIISYLAKQKYFEQIHYLYQDACGTEYSVYSKSQYIQYIGNFERLKENTIKAIKYAENLDLTHHPITIENIIRDINNLYYANNDYACAAFHQMDDIQIIKSTEQLIKSINGNQSNQ
jgi:hypothetical protein